MLKPKPYKLSPHLPRIDTNKGHTYLWGATEFGGRDHDGKTAMEYIAARYTQGECGFMGDRPDVIFFYDKGHRDEFVRRFGGTTLTLRRKGPKDHSGDRAMDILKKAYGNG